MKNCFRLNCFIWISIKCLSLWIFVLPILSGGRSYIYMTTAIICIVTITTIITIGLTRNDVTVLVPTPILDKEVKNILASMRGWKLPQNYDITTHKACTSKCHPVVIIIIIAITTKNNACPSQSHANLSSILSSFHILRTHLLCYPYMQYYTRYHQPSRSHWCGFHRNTKCHSEAQRSWSHEKNTPSYTSPHQLDWQDNN